MTAHSAHPGAAFAELSELYQARSSARAFAPAPLPRDRLLELFAAAQRAPSWCNVQPWRVVVTEPPTTGRVTAALVAAAQSQPAAPEVAFPADYPSPHLEHRRACGLALYQAMGVARDDKEGRQRAWLRNYQGFDAPHLAVVSCDRRLGPYAYVDLGVWLGYLLPAAQALGIATCPMASIATYPAVLRERLPISPEDTIVFGVALGVADAQAAANQCRTQRDPVSANVQFV